MIDSQSSRRVSIHAPVRMRQVKSFTLKGLLSFNSRTREDATFKVVCYSEQVGFNSRTREDAT